MMTNAVVNSQERGERSDVELPRITWTELANWYLNARSFEQRIAALHAVPSAALDAETILLWATDDDEQRRLSDLLATSTDHDHLDRVLHARQVQFLVHVGSKTSEIERDPRIRGEARNVLVHEVLPELTVDDHDTALRALAFLATNPVPCETQDTRDCIAQFLGTVWQLPITHPGEPYLIRKDGVALAIRARAFSTVVTHGIVEAIPELFAYVAGNVNRVSFRRIETMLRSSAWGELVRTSDGRTLIAHMLENEDGQEQLFTEDRSTILAACDAALANRIPTSSAPLADLHVAARALLELLAALETWLRRDPDDDLPLELS